MRRSRRLLLASCLVVVGLAFSALALEASAQPLEGADVTTFMVTGVTQVTHLAFIVQPSSTATAGQPFATQPQVAVEDSNNNVVTGDASVVTLSKASASPGTGNLSCTGGDSSTAVAGIATFVGCLFDAAGTYVINAADGTLAPAVSNPVDVSAAPPAPTATPVPGGGGGGGGGGGSSPAPTPVPTVAVAASPAPTVAPVAPTPAPTQTRTP